MTDFVSVCSIHELPPGTMKAVMIDGRKVTVYRTATGIYASDNSCPHRGGPLVEGDLIGEDVVCPWHCWTFHLQTGENDREPEIRLTMHEVRVIEDEIQVKVIEPR